jgi:hypothetical protein
MAIVDHCVVCIRYILCGENATENVAAHIAQESSDLPIAMRAVPENGGVQASVRSLPCSRPVPPPLGPAQKRL